MISFNSDRVALPRIDTAKVFAWLHEVAAVYGYRIGTLNYMFCDDEEIIRSNREFLGHDYYTDIITFESSIGKKLGADILISLDTVKSNASKFNVDYNDELLRVIVHGLLHLCGLKDKLPEEREIMEQAENDALSLYKQLEES